MQVICTDGTTFTCAGYELTKYGVKLLAEDRDGDDERYDTEPDDVGYVPHDRLWYIVPDGVQPNGPPLSAPTGQRQGPNSPAPPQQNTGAQPSMGPTSGGPGPRP